MSLKQSCFKSIVKSDIKRSWWISALAALFIFMSSTSPLFNRGYDYYSFPRFDDTLDFVNNMFMNYFVGGCVAAFAVLYLFSYVNKVNSVTFFHALPATRNTLLSAHIASGALIVVSPMLINVIISFFAVSRGVKASWILAGFFVYIVYSFVIFATTLVVSMLTGVSIASGIFTGVVLLLPLFVFAFVSELCSDYLYGFAGFDIFEDFLMKYVYLTPDSLMSSRVLIYIALVVVFFALSFFIYKKRHLENYGEVIAFTGLKGLFKVIFGLCSGVLSYYYFQAFWDISSILTMLVFGTLGVIIAHMLANRSFSLKGVLKPLAITAGLILLLFVSFFFDFFCFEKRIPDIDEIEYVDIGNLYYNDYTYVDSDVYGESRVRVEKKDPFIPHFSTKEEIQLFLDLHKYAIDNQKDNDDWNDDFFTPSYKLVSRNSFRIEYTLKNGKVLKRYYRLPNYELERYTSRIYSTDTYRKWKYPVLDGKEKTYKSVGIYDARTYFDYDYVRLLYSNENAKRIIDAIAKDRQSISYSRMNVNDFGAMVNIELNYTIPYVDENGKEYQVERSEGYAIGKNDVNTWAILEELDVFGKVRKIELDDIKSADVFFDEYIFAVNAALYGTDVYPTVSAAQMEKAVTYVEDVYIHEYKKTGDYHKNFTDKADIETLYDLYMSHHNGVIPVNQGSVRFTVNFEMKDKNVRSRTLILPENELPEILSYLTELYTKE